MIKYPYRDLLPPLASDEFEALAASIRATGVRDAVCLDESGNVLDGHHRLQIDPRAPTRVIEGLSEAEKRAFVFQANLTRRNLSPDQKREALRQMKAIAEALRAENPKKNTQARVAAILGVAQSTVAGWFITNIGVDNTYKPDARVKLSPTAAGLIIERIERGETQSQVAADFGVTQPKISQILSREKRITDRLVRIGEARELPTSSYSLVLADPPWQYDFSPTASRRIENQYPTLTVKQICDLPVMPLFNRDCILFLWATAPKLREALEVLAVWGFYYKTSAVWVKDKIGMGYYFRSQHELLLVGTRGDIPPPQEKTRLSSVLTGPRGRHSQKPEAVFAALDRMYPEFANPSGRVELFQRTSRPGWSAWGNE